MPRFVQYAWDRFDPLTVANLLLSLDDAHADHRRVLGRAFRVWAVAPHQPKLIRDAIERTAADILVTIERGLANGNAGPSRDRAASLSRHAPFFNEIYYPIGGADVLLKARSPDAIRVSIRRASRGIEQTVYMTGVAHYRVSHPDFDASRFAEPSRARASEVLRGITHPWQPAPPLEGRRARSYWYQFLPALAFIYAAADIRRARGRPLLESLCDGDPPEDGDGYREWFGRAKFVQEAILARMADPRHTDLAFLDLSGLGVESVRFDPPPFAPPDRERISRSFERNPQRLTPRSSRT